MRAIVRYASACHAVQPKDTIVAMTLAPFLDFVEDGDSGTFKT